MLGLQERASLHGGLRPRRTRAWYIPRGAHHCPVTSLSFALVRGLGAIPLRNGLCVPRSCGEDELGPAINSVDIPDELLSSLQESTAPGTVE